ncbi:dTDP-4-amino-4,6-dideoxygalactose transaminase [Reichenbachiella sp.]|uniref:dTDP-4-amino-4,6-dideoxygalactose transaminase n=1 Tax=Reichenbachiella sp. TaxID=2184521 RepID=UPI003B5992DE
MTIPFNKPHLTGRETLYITKAVDNGHISGNGKFTKKCHAFFEKHYHFKKCLLTTSCTDALEMCAILLNIKKGDEVIMPTFTFVSTANAFVLRGAKVVFCDSQIDNPNIDADKIEELITKKTKAIVVVHYAGVACKMDKIMTIANKHNLFVVEDAAQAIDSYFNEKPLGGIGHLSAFSFHETKNLIAGEGGMLVINDESLLERAEIVWEKGTNRSAFFRGEIDKYNWVDIGSSFLPSEINAAFLYAQLMEMENIQNKRKQIHEQYFKKLSQSQNSLFKLPTLPHYATNNAHMFYLICKNQSVRNGLIDHLRNLDIQAVFHYLPLHKSPFIQEITKTSPKNLKNAENFAGNIIRLPFYYQLQNDQISLISKQVLLYLNKFVW